MTDAELKERVLKAIDAGKDDIVGFLRDLIRIKSVNPVFVDSKPMEERECQEFIADYLRRYGFIDIDMWEPDPVALREKYLGYPGYTENREFRNRPNLVARLPGVGGGRSLFLTGHVDVVNADAATENWKHDPWEGAVDDGFVYGRGAADMKGGIAAMIQAVRFLREAGVKLKGDVLVGTVVDEETGSMGMLSLVDRGYRADAGIMTEPTDLRLSLLCRGIIWGRIRIRGRAGHIEVSQPHWREGGAVDAIEKGMKIINALQELNREWARRPDKRHRLLPRPCEINVSMVNAGQHPSSYAEECTITVDIQYLPSERDARGLGGNVKREVEEFLRKVADTDSWLREHPPIVEWFVDADCAEVAEGHPLVGIMQTHIARFGWPSAPTGSEFHTDMSLLTNNGTPTVNFGPGDPFVAHLTNERVPIDQLVDATKIIALCILDWCGYVVD